MHLSHDTLVAVADGEKLHLFRTEGNEAKPHLRPVGHPHVEGSNHSGGVHHQSGPANPDEHQDAKDMFAAATADLLNRAATDNSFSHAVVIAPPRTLGELRRHFNKALESKIVKEIPKDLTGQSLDQIATALEQA